MSKEQFSDEYENVAIDEMKQSTMLVIYPADSFPIDVNSRGRKKIFLNEWCAKEFLLTKDFSQMFEIASPPYLTQEQRDIAIARVELYEDKFFSALVRILNEHHKSNYSEAFWKKLFGNWFRRFVQMTFYNLTSIESCLSSHKIDEILALQQVFPSTPFNFTADFNYLRSDTSWVSNFNLKLLTFIKRSDYEIIYMNFKSQNVLPLENKSKVKNHKRILSDCIYSIVKIFSSTTKYFLFSTYLPRRSEILLNLSLWQIPQRWKCPEVFLGGLEDVELRRELTSQLKDIDSSGVEAALAELIFDYFPVCYLEGWKDLKSSVNALNWPRSPKAIFTSNEFDTNEHFKVWAALKCLNGTKYFVGQHGNNYGTNRYMRNSIEEVTSDKFITWGWSEGLKNHFKGINLKTAGLDFHQYSNSSSVLLVGAPFENEVDVWCGNFSYRTYIKDQTIFLARLSPRVLDRLVVRPYQSTGATNQSECRIWSSQLENFTLDVHRSFYESVKNSKLVIFSYDSTGLLELLSLNIPVVAFWQNEFSHVSESALPFYEELRRVGILHHSPESIAHHVNKIYPEILTWWNSITVQAARSTFCNEYSAKTMTPIKFLSNVIKKS
jgi:putative transferase (TIGR04331 family)